MHIDNALNVTALLIGKRWYNVVAGTVRVSPVEYGSDYEQLHAKDTSDIVSFEYYNTPRGYGQDSKMMIRASQILGVQYK